MLHLRGMLWDGARRGLEHPPRVDGRDQTALGPRRIAAIVVVSAVSIIALAYLAAKERDLWIELHPPAPSLLGLRVGDAARRVIPFHFYVNVVGYRQDPRAPFGVILAQDPLPGSSLLVRSTIQLTVSLGSGLVPALRRVPVSSAAGRLEKVGLRLGRVLYVHDHAARDTVLKQYVPPGRHLAVNSPVDVLLSDGPPPPLVTPPVPSSGPRPARHPNPVAEAAKQVHVKPIERSDGAGAIYPERSTDTQCERPQVCAQSAHDRGAQPDVHGPEHRWKRASP